MNTTIIGVGDIMPGGIFSGKKNGWISNDIKALLRGANLRVGTLECAIGNVPMFNEEKMKRLGDVIYARDCDLEKLVELDINIVSLANNHFFDLGYEGAEHTINLLDKKGISHIGAGRNIYEAKAPVVKYHDNNSIAFVAFCDWRDDTVGWCPIATESTPGVNPMYESHVVNEIRCLKQLYDYVVVMPHWGRENTWITSKHVYQMAKIMIKAGADVVLGSHPHRVHPVVNYHNHVVAFSLGNFLFPDRLICPPRSTYYDDAILDYSQLPHTDKYPYVNEITYKSWNYLANIGIILKIDLSKMKTSHYLTLMKSDRGVCFFSDKKIERLLLRRGMILRFLPYKVYLFIYSLFSLVKSSIFSFFINR